MDQNPSRLGQVNQANDAKALFLKVFAGEVLTAFDKSAEFMDKHVVRQIQHGKSAQFPASGRTSASYHTPGTQLVGDKFNHNEVVISIDDLLVAKSFIANIDEAMNHYDVRSEYSRKMGEVLAQTFDQNVARNGVLAARGSANVADGDGGATANNGNYKTTATTLAGGIFSAAQSLDEKFVPDSDRYCFVKPAQYYLLAQTTNLINKDWDGRGSYAEGAIHMVAGIPLVKTMNLPTADDSSNTDLPSGYRADFSVTAALVMHREAVGTVKLLDLATEMEYQIERQGTLMVAKYAVGHGKLRPESAVELRTTDPS